MSLIRKIVWYVEAHLERNPDLAEISRATDASRFHITRLFAAVSQRPLMAYVRARRLSQAAKALMVAGDILDVAVANGYGSHAAFTRAFRAEFGMSPKDLRLSGNLAALALTEPFSMTEIKTLPTQTPRLVDGAAMTIAGLAHAYTMTQLTGIPGQWQAFRDHFGHIDGQVGGVCYGVSYDFKPDGLTYMSGVEIDGSGILPDGFSTIKIPSGRYAIFEHHGHVSGISDTWRAIYDAWLANAGLKPQYTPSFERMDERFDGHTGIGVIEIWVPVVR
ncbi:AraC family transcriptional regulator [Asticcacaulis sp. EMRT-3]|uniref:AraC family transcriptional regulator n=1 Tax=Asticcacaulis sp. EMRT-3 TaxID=3040349 RepID=UPI0024AF2298|nr:AraC family transcriptional regulator [Asticcacaulis sp. EMRT-3]MDI7776035.1 AraC family transcriptional regulator [Asticcacaulis sp. EMRT-3]